MMPLGIQRINARHQQPNSRIVFIKPLPGPTAAFAQDFLERIAAISHPIMKAHHLSITSLEEYPPNPEFAGRNFNAGEVIQLVLRARGTNNAWLSFRQVQMVMMHELAHCLQMNHSRAFWALRNTLATDLRALWHRGYTGDGFWGRGATTLSGTWHTPTNPLPPDSCPRDLCGGAYRSFTRRRQRRGQKRKRGPDENAKPTVSSAERRQARITKKFGAGGIKLGGDIATRTKLENGRTVKAQPRVASSVRGRQLRAAAALARMSDQNATSATSGARGGNGNGGIDGCIASTTSKEENPNEQKEQKPDISRRTTKIKIEPSLTDGSEVEAEDEEAEGGGDALLDMNGLRVVDARGCGLVRVCGGAGEDEGEEEGKREWEEMMGLGGGGGAVRGG